MPRSLRVFLCHSSKDKFAVRELYKKLCTESWIDPWLDEEKLFPGQDWHEEIEKAVEATDVVIVLLSTQSVSQEGYVQRELKLALDVAEEKPENTIFIIPLRLDDCPAPRRLRGWHYVDYFPTDRKDWVMERLIASLKLRAEALGIKTTALETKTDTHEKAEQEAKEQAEREAAEKAVREKLELEAIEKTKREKAEQQAIEKAAREKHELQAIEKTNREQAEKQVFEKTRLEAEELARHKDAKEKAEQEVVEKATPEKTEHESAKNRMLEAAIQKQVIVDKPASLYVWIKQFGSKSIISVVKSDVDKFAVLDGGNVESNGLMIEFPIDNGKLKNAIISLRLIAPEFSPSMQQKELEVPIEGDSKVCTFLVTPKKAGELLLNIEVCKGEISVVNRNLWTTAVETVVKEPRSMVLLSIPIFVFVQPKSNELSVGGDVSGSVIISGNGNIVHIDNNKEEPKKEVPSKPFTKLLDPSSLSSNKTLSSPQGGKQSAKKSAPNNNLLWLGIGGIVLLILFFCGFGLNYLIKNLPASTVTVSATTIVSSPTTMATPKLPASTSIPFTHTPTLTKTTISTPTLGIGSTRVSKKDGMTLLYVPEGDFTMGENYYFPNVRPVHQVTLNTFWIDQTEVTNAMYAKCVDAGKCDLPNNTSHFSNSSYANHPVVYVSWNDAVTYCSWADRRLPTEAEWEKTARGSNANTYPWGNDAPNDDLIRGTIEVGKYPNEKSFYGAYDMANYVWEWVSSLYQPYPYNANDGRENLSSSGLRILRGGAFFENNYIVHSSYRLRYDPTDSYLNIGFRCALDDSP